MNNLKLEDFIINETKRGLEIQYKGSENICKIKSEVHPKFINYHLIKLLLEKIK
jgi:hypothetical protein